MARYARGPYPDDHSDPWPPPDMASHAVSGHQPPLKNQYWPWVAIGVLVIILLVGLCVVMGIGMGTGNQDGTTGYVTPSPIGTPGQGSRPKAVPEVKKIDEGMWQVGNDVEPGRYKSKGMRENGLICYWHTAKDTTTDQIESQGVSDKVGAQAYVTLKKGQWFQTTGCESWVLQPS